MEELLDQKILEETEIPEEIAPELEQEPQEEMAQEEAITAQMQLQELATALVAYGGSGNPETVTQEFTSVMETLMETHALEVEQSEKVGKLTFALSALVYDTGAVMALIDVNEVNFDPANLSDLRDFLEPIYTQKPYLFKAISPLRGANIATGITGNTLPTNQELGALSMEEYTAYRNARGSASY